MKTYLVLAAALLAIFSNGYSQNSKVYVQRGIAKFEAEKFTEAIAEFNLALRSNPNNAPALCYRGKAKTELGDYFGAIEDFSKAIAINPKEADYYFWRGYAKTKAGNARPKPQQTTVISVSRYEPTPEARINAEQIAKYNEDQAYWRDQRNRYLSGDPTNAIDRMTFNDQTALATQFPGRTFINGGSYVDNSGRQQNAPIRTMPAPKDPIAVNQSQYTSVTYFSDSGMPQYYSAPAIAVQPFKPADTTRKPSQNVVLSTQPVRLPTDSIPSGGNGGFQLTTPEFTPIRLDMGHEPQQTQSTTPAAIYGGAPTMPAQVVNAISQGQPTAPTRKPDWSPYAEEPWRKNFYIDSLKVAEMQRKIDSANKVIDSLGLAFAARKAAEARAAQEAQARSADANHYQPPGDYREALADYTKAIELNPDFSTAYYNRGLVKQALNDLQGACMDWSKAGEKGMIDAYETIQRHCR